jgi:hypothetical protein
MTCALRYEWNQALLDSTVCSTSAARLEPLFTIVCVIMMPLQLAQAQLGFDRLNVF